MEGGWFRVAHPPHGTAYIQRDLVEVLPRTIDATGAMIALRAEPGSSATIVKQTPLQGNFEISALRDLPEQGRWYRLHIDGIPLWVAATEVRPRFALPAAHFLAGLLAYQAARLTEADQEWQQTITAPAMQADHVALATAYQWLGATRLRAPGTREGDTAYAAFSHALALTPYDPHAYTLRALATLKEQGSITGALQDVTQALGLDKRHEPARVMVRTLTTQESRVSPAQPPPLKAQTIPEQLPSSPSSASSQGVPRTIRGQDGKEMQLVPEGSFLMGSENGEPDERPEHVVWLDAFYMDTYEVTREEYGRFVQTTGYRAPGRIFREHQENHPIVNVSWEDASTYCRWANKQLPTEAQWEKAARGTDGRMYPWGNEAVNGKRANYCDVRCLNLLWNDNDEDDGYSSTAPVGSHPQGQSPYGIHDLAGNVWEWVQDVYSSDYYQRSPARNPINNNSNVLSFRVLRGGSWLDPPAYLRPANRFRDAPGYRLVAVGFRCVAAVAAPRP